MIILDDLQWTDKATLGLFSFIARNISNLPILQVGLYRRDRTFSSEVIDEASLIETVRQLKIEGTADQLDISRFTEEETKKSIVQLFEGKKVEQRLIEKVIEQTEGHPLFISEMIHLMKGKGFVGWDGKMWRLKADQESGIVSQKVQDVILQRVDRLDKELREILEIASCEGEYFRSDTLVACLQIKRIVLLKQLQSLEKGHGLIRHESSRYRFDHFMIRQVLYETIIPELREEYHRMIADGLIDKHSSEDEFASLIAHHLLASGREQDSLNYLLKAANRARDLHAAEEALTTYQKLQTILQRNGFGTITLRSEVEEGLGDVFSSTGKAQEAIRCYKNFLRLARQAAKPLSEIEALRKLAESNRLIGKISEAMKMCKQAMSMATESGNEANRLNCLNTMAYIHASRGEYDRTIDLSEHAVSLAKNLGDPKNQSIALSNLGFAYWHLGNYQPAMEQFNEALSMQQSIGDNRGLSTTLNFLGLAYEKLGQYEKALESAFESVRLKERIAHFRAIPGSLNVIGDVYRDMFDPEKAISYHTQSLELARKQNNKGAMCDNIRDLGADYMLLGDFQTALKYFEETLELSKAAVFTWYETKSYNSLGEWYRLMEQDEKAQQYADLGLEYSEKLNAKELRIEALWIQALVRADESASEETENLFKQAIDQAQKIGHNTILWQLYFDYYTFLRGQNRLDEMKNAHEESTKILQTIVDHFRNADLKEKFLNSSKVKEVFGEL